MTQSRGRTLSASEKEWLNKACERLTGIEAAEVLGTQEHWRGFYDSPRPCLADLVAHVLKASGRWA